MCSLHTRGSAGVIVAAARADLPGCAGGTFRQALATFSRSAVAALSQPPPLLLRCIIMEIEKAADRCRHHKEDKGIGYDVSRFHEVIDTKTLHRLS
jgi:hypothetical protein